MSHVPPSALPHYRAFGLTMESTLPLPELPVATGWAPPDVVIRSGMVPAELPDSVIRGVRYSAAPGRVLLRVDGVARFLVEQGRTVTLMREAGADDDDVRTFLLGAALGALLQQRGDLVLRGSAVMIDGVAIGLIGSAGAGTSTLAAACWRRGHTVISDEMCVVREGADGRLLVQPGFPHVRMQPAALRQLDIPGEGLRRLRRRGEKRWLPVAGALAGQARPMRKLQVIHPGAVETLQLTPVPGLQRFKLLHRHTFRMQFLVGPGELASHFRLASRLAGEVGMTVFERPLDRFLMREAAARIEETAGA